MFEKERKELHEKAVNLAFAFYLRKGRILPIINEVAALTASPDIFAKALHKFNQNHDPVNGQFTSGASGSAADSNTSSRKKDPGAIPVKLSDDSTVINPKTNQPLLMPADVSLSNNAKTGENMRFLPSVLTGDIMSPDKERAMIDQLDTNRPMDYQRLYDDGKINKTYIDFGNYNYGVVAAAAGYTLPQAMLAAAFHNRSVGNPDTSGTWGTDSSESTFIPMG